MSRSTRKPIIKDRPRNHKKSSLYWRSVRSTIKQSIREISQLEDKEDFEIPNPKEIVNDYNYCDYVFDYEHYDLDEEYKQKLSRK